MKKIFILLLVIILLFVPVMSYAEEITVIPPNDGNSYYYYSKDNSGCWYCVTTNSLLYKNGDFLHFKNTSTYKHYKLSYSGVWELTNTRTVASSEKIVNSSMLKGSNVTVYMWDGETVFFSPPKVSPLLLTMKNQSPVAILKIILAGLIPLLGLVILAISFRKAWGFLHNLLQH